MSDNVILLDINESSKMRRLLCYLLVKSAAEDI